MGDEEIGTCGCGRPADRYTPVSGVGKCRWNGCGRDSTLGFHPGEPICSECVEAAPARQEVAVPDDYFDEGDAANPGDAAKPQNTDDGGKREEFPPLTDADFIFPPPGWEEEWRARMQQAKVVDDDTTGYPEPPPPRTDDEDDII